MCVCDCLRCGARCDAGLARRRRRALEQVCIDMIKAGMRFKLVLMDRNMPRMDGLEATRRLRELCPDTPVVAVTGNALDVEQAEFVAAGACRVLTKPLDTDALNAVLRAHLGGTAR